MSEELKRLEDMLANLLIAAEANDMQYRPRDFMDVIDMTPERARVCAAAANLSSRIDLLKGRGRPFP